MSRLMLCYIAICDPSLAIVQQCITVFALLLPFLGLPDPQSVSIRTYLESFGDGLEISTSSSLAIVLSRGIFEKRSVISRRKQPSSFDQVSEFDRGRIVAYRDCGLPFWEIGSRVGRNQTTVMRICDLWMQNDTTNQCD
ncbi:HTH_38 domain-containing protein [Trichonephila clavipes]|nr:HTH_38 domain-containing protein [Trichonephila clavipes]